MEKELVNEISLSYKKEKGNFKGVNTKSTLIDGVACTADIQIGPWKGKVDITATPLEDRKFYFGMDFLNKARCFIVPYASTLYIMDKGKVMQYQ